jgi:hypothetical protein
MSTTFSGPIVSTNGFTGDITGDVTGNVVGNVTGLVNGASLVKITETVAFGAFTDGGSTSGTYDITAGTLPVGSVFLKSAVTAVTGFAGDTSAVLTIGDGTDADRYNTGTPDVFSTIAAGIDVGAPSGLALAVVADTITLTVTSATDFTSVSAGSLTVEFYYLT